VLKKIFINLGKRRIDEGWAWDPHVTYNLKKKNGDQGVTKEID